MSAPSPKPNFPWRRTGAGALALLLGGCNRGVLDPQGPVGVAEKTLLLNATGIMLCVVVPVMIATVCIPWWFRASNTKARYRPTWAYSGKVELIIWSIPAMIILLLGGVTWIACHELDPARPLASSQKAIEVQVVSLDWKWLFIYPKEGIASVNRIVVPVGTPVHMRLTSATVMNSFFVPQLGGQIYTMTGMVSQLNLIADRAGSYDGLSAQFSGDGFSDMHFRYDAVSRPAFNAWIAAAKAAGSALDARGYAALARPSSAVAPITYATIDPTLFDRISVGKPIATAAVAPHPMAADHGASNKGF
ncbi:cytochrome o ubiquinol oxidase subunit 2 [Sphingomonas sp. NFR04]|uniref:ubiquinol oxidase subunit II n=1 Tax=Sphingomonas sp. NFR04 TaxID=1566283 RepID=UPI0008E0F177|nr:ubiquinol oxidase subunit II [Sphingomonas sp. NFR04]SFK11555.1 cytochrome o ubiquinol oxidase subunit 2 [Sphingomonas sp. NFR04]